MVTNLNISQSADPYGLYPYMLKKRAKLICKAFNIDLPQIYIERTRSSGMEGCTCICIDKSEVNKILKIMIQSAVYRKHRLGNGPFC